MEPTAWADSSSESALSGGSSEIMSQTPLERAKHRYRSTTRVPSAPDSQRWPIEDIMGNQIELWHFDDGRAPPTHPYTF
jgi:hypothetical protein